MTNLLVASYGGGRNSCAGLIGLHQRGFRPDRIQFSDTGIWDAEKPETYAHIRLMSDWCEAHGFPPITIVRMADQYPNEPYPTLEARCLALGHLPSLVYGFRACSERWKRRPQRADLEEWLARPFGPVDPQVTRAIFYAADEASRAKSNRGDSGETLWFPLIEWGWDLNRCLEEIDKAGLPRPPKSACFFCPASKKREVLELKRQHPELFARAVALERNAAAYNTTVKGLGRHWSWEELGRADDAQFSLFSDAVQMPCMCFDGDDESEAA